MKKIFVACLFLGVASVQAAFIQCIPLQGTVVDGAVGQAVVYTCSPGAGADAGTSDDNVAGDGVDITALRLQISGTFQENNGAVGQIFSVLFTSTNNLGALSPGNPTCTATDAADANNQALGACVSTTLGLNIGLMDFVPAFTVTVTGGPGSNPLPFNASASVFYEVSTQAPPPPPGIPEPTTYSMLALGLIAFYRYRRSA